MPPRSSAVDELVAVLDPRHRALDVLRLQRGLNQGGIGRVVLEVEDVERGFHPAPVSSARRQSTAGRVGLQRSGGGSLTAAQKMPSCWTACHELAELHRLHDVGIDAELVELDQVRRLARGGQHHDRNRAAVVVGLDGLQHLEAVDLRHLDVEQDHDRVAARARSKCAPAVQVVQRLRAVAHDHDLVGEVVLVQRRQRELDVAQVVFHEQDVAESFMSCSLRRLRQWKSKRSRRRPPRPRAQTRPPCRWMMRCTLARPMPVPSNSSWLCRRWKTPNSLSAYRGSKPAPLSRMKITGLAVAAARAADLDVGLGACGR